MEFITCYCLTTHVGTPKKGQTNETNIITIIIWHGDGK